MAIRNVAHQALQLEIQLNQKRKTEVDQQIKYKNEFSIFVYRDLILFNLTVKPN